MERSQLLDSSLPCSSGENESVGDKLRREAVLVLAGMGGGFVEAAGDSVKSPHIAETTAKVALGVCIGAGLAYLSKGKSLCKTSVQVFGGVAAISFAGDVLLNAKAVGGALSDTWQSDDNWNRNLTTMKRTAGQFALIPAALMTAAGITGGALQPKLSTMFRRPTAPMLEIAPIEGLAVRDPAHPLGFPHQADAMAILPTMKPNGKISIDMYAASTTEAQLAARYGESIVRVEVLPANSDLPFLGSGFFVAKDGTIATCFHVIESTSGVGATCKINMGGKTLTARVRSIDAANDLALLKVDGLAAEAIQPLPLARGTASLAPEAGTLTLGYSGSNCLVASPGKIDKQHSDFRKCLKVLADHRKQHLLPFWSYRWRWLRRSRLQCSDRRSNRRTLRKQP